MAKQREILLEGQSAEKIELNQAAQTILNAFGGQIVQKNLRILQKTFDKNIEK